MYKYSNVHTRDRWNDMTLASAPASTSRCFNSPETVKNSFRCCQLRIQMFDRSAAVDDEGVCARGHAPEHVGQSGRVPPCRRPVGADKVRRVASR